MPSPPAHTLLRLVRPEAGSSDPHTRRLRGLETLDTTAMNDCCLREAKLHLDKHRDVARCDDCGALILAYENERDFRSMVSELESRGMDFETERLGRLYIVAKPA